MHVTNRLLLPRSIVRAVANDPYLLEDRGHISATELIDSPRIRLLKKKHADALEEDASERIWALFGQGVHAALERAVDEFDIAEQRFRVNVDGWDVSAKVDLISCGALYDYKVTKAWAAMYGMKPEWERQLNVGAWLASKNGVKVESVAVVALLRDWDQTKIKEGGRYPRAPVVEIAAEIWPADEQERYITDRVRLHRLSEVLMEEDGIMPAICTAEVRWARNGGDSIRCRDWCPVRSVCDFGVEVRNGL